MWTPYLADISWYVTSVDRCNQVNPASSAGSMPTPGTAAIFRLFSTFHSVLLVFQSADPSAHSMAFQHVCVYATSTCASQIQTATAVDLKLCRTLIPPCSLISLWQVLRAMLSQYPILGGEVLCLHNPIRIQGKTCKFTRFQVIPPKKTAFRWWHCSVTSYNHKWWILSWSVLKRKEQLKDDANLSWIKL